MVGDWDGILHAVQLPQQLRRATPHERSSMASFMANQLEHALHPAFHPPPLDKPPLDKAPQPDGSTPTAATAGTKGVAAAAGAAGGGDLKGKEQRPPSAAARAAADGDEGAEAVFTAEEITRAEEQYRCLRGKNPATFCCCIFLTSNLGMYHLHFAIEKDLPFPGPTLLEAGRKYVIYIMNQSLIKF